MRQFWRSIHSPSNEVLQLRELHTYENAINKLLFLEGKKERNKETKKVLFKYGYYCLIPLDFSLEEALYSQLSIAKKTLKWLSTVNSQ